MYWSTIRYTNWENWFLFFNSTVPLYIRGPRLKSRVYSNTSSLYSPCPLQSQMAIACACFRPCRSSRIWTLAPYPPFDMDIRDCAFIRIGLSLLLIMTRFSASWLEHCTPATITAASTCAIKIYEKRL